MSIHYANYRKYDFPHPQIIEELINRFEETSDSPNRHEHFTESELNDLLKLCDIAEKQAVDANQVFGFVVKSEDRAPLEAMLNEKLPRRHLNSQQLAVIALKVDEMSKLGCNVGGLSNRKLYVVIDRQSPNAVIGVFAEIKEAKETAKMFRFEQNANSQRKDLDNSPWIWEVAEGKSYFNRLPREIC